MRISNSIAINNNPASALSAFINIDEDYLKAGEEWWHLNDNSDTVVKLRRATDDATSDFTGAELHDGTAETWCGGSGAGNHGLIDSWYSPYGGAILIQTTLTQQPTLIKDGVLLVEDGHPFIEFDGVDDSLFVSQGLINRSVNPNFVCCTARVRSGTRVGLLDSTPSNYASNRVSYYMSATTGPGLGTVLSIRNAGSSTGHQAERPASTTDTLVVAGGMGASNMAHAYWNQEGEPAKTMASATGGTYLRLGWQSASTLFNAVNIKELYITHAPVIAEEPSVINYYMTKYGI